MLHHVTLETDPADLERFAEFWGLLGFAEVEPPPALRERFTWFERAGTQVHLAHSDSPTVPPQGHTAVVAPDFDAAVAALRDHGFDVTPARPHWGSPRAFAIAPGGHRVELMAFPPAQDPSQ